MHLMKSFSDLETGICLWIGAGVTKHLALSIGGSVPDWNALTADLEAMAGSASHSNLLSNPARLDACAAELGASTFRQAVSRRIYGALCVALTQFAHTHRGQLATPPGVAFELAALGWLANPIVNFNVETLTSYLVARPAGPCRLLPYRIRDNSSAGAYEEQECSSDFWRTVYHPHGAVNYSGQAVMTSAEYDAHDGSLAYLLSVSAAFENNLWIVGMSVDDGYLREHLRRHRNQINEVRWFDSEVQLKKHEVWARDSRVTLVPVVWRDFWTAIREALGRQVRRAGVMTAWFHTLGVAMQELVEGTPEHQLQQLAKLIPELSPAAQRTTANSRASYRHVFENGEGRRLLPEGFDRTAITNELTAAIRDASDLVRTIQQTVRESGSDTGGDMASALEYAIPMLPRMRSMNI